MEIERKFKINKLPDNLEDYRFHMIEQAYLNIHPVIRIRQQDEEYYLTYKGQGLLVREEYNLPLTKEAYEHLKTKADGNIISKKRYLIPLDSSCFLETALLSEEERNTSLTIELDVFDSPFAPLVLAEVEFPDKITALNYQKPAWFGPEVTNQSTFQNSVLSTK